MNAPLLADPERLEDLKSRIWGGAGASRETLDEALLELLRLLTTEGGNR